MHYAGMVYSNFVEYMKENICDVTTISGQQTTYITIKKPNITIRVYRILVYVCTHGGELIAHQCNVVSSTLYLIALLLPNALKDTFER